VATLSTNREGDESKTLSVASGTSDDEHYATGRSFGQSDSSVSGMSGRSRTVARRRRRRLARRASKNIGRLVESSDGGDERRCTCNVRHQLGCLVGSNTRIKTNGRECNISESDDSNVGARCGSSVRNRRDLCRGTVGTSRVWEDMEAMGMPGYCRETTNNRGSAENGSVGNAGFGGVAERQAPKLRRTPKLRGKSATKVQVDTNTQGVVANGGSQESICNRQEGGSQTQDRPEHGNGRSDDVPPVNSGRPGRGEHLTYDDGNLLEHIGPIAHCIGADARMGAGVAKQLLELYPELRKVRADAPQVGYTCPSVLVSMCDDRDIYNMVTKPESAVPGVRLGDLYYEHFERCFDTVAEMVAGGERKSLGIPDLPGTGLDAGDYKRLKRIIIGLARDHGIRVVAYRNRRRSDKKLEKCQFFRTEQQFVQQELGGVEPSAPPDSISHDEQGYCNVEGEKEDHPGSSESGTYEDCEDDGSSDVERGGIRRVEQSEIGHGYARVLRNCVPVLEKWMELLIVCVSVGMILPGMMIYCIYFALIAPHISMVVGLVGIILVRGPALADFFWRGGVSRWWTRRRDLCNDVFEEFYFNTPQLRKIANDLTDELSWIVFGTLRTTPNVMNMKAQAKSWLMKYYPKMPFADRKVICEYALLNAIHVSAAEKKLLSALAENVDDLADLGKWQKLQQVKAVAPWWKFWSRGKLVTLPSNK